MLKTLQGHSLDQSPRRVSEWLLSIERLEQPARQEAMRARSPGHSVDVAKDLSQREMAITL